jgi:mannose-1-phosphate guanylyltransferase
MTQESKQNRFSARDPIIQDAVVVIMAGGAGTRFWPASTLASPKQFLAFFSERSLLQQAYDRVSDWVDPERILVLTSKAHVDLCRQQLPNLAPYQVIGEPERKDTAAAVALAALLAQKRFGDPTMMVLAADHLMEPASEVKRTFGAALEGASQGDALYTLGIEPLFPSTGFGYLQLGEEETQIDGIAIHALHNFVEKPDHEKAKHYLQSGDYLWNSGMFFWRTSTILNEFQKNLPEHLEILSTCIRADKNDDFDALLAKDFAALPRVSVDYGIMEKAERVRTAKASFQWSDVGGFPALAEHLPHDDKNNAYRGQIFPHEASDNLVFCQDSDETVALIGVKDLIVVRAGKRTLVVPKDRAQEIKELVGMLPIKLQ